MPPGRDSRYLFCEAVTQSDGTLMLSDREPYGFRPFEDNIRHTSQEGDTWWSLSARYYAAMGDRAHSFYWAIADFQPEPVVDSTLKIEPNTVIHVPSLRTLQEEILSEKRRADHR